MPQFIVEVYRRDRRTRPGWRRVEKNSHAGMDTQTLKRIYSECYPADQGYRFEIQRRLG